MFREYWIYQNRQSDDQWAIYVGKNHSREKPHDTQLTYTIYSDSIDNATRSITRTRVHYDTVGGYVDDILSTIAVFSAIEQQDKDQLERAILDILLH